MGLLGRVVKMDVDTDGEASGAFLRAHVAIEEPRWFQVQYKKLPYYCFACGMIGHSELECLHPMQRDDQGKLPYDVHIRAPEDRKKRWPSFAGAVAKSFGSGSSSTSKPPRTRFSHSGDTRSSMGDDGSHHSSEYVGDTEDQEVQYPLK